MWSLGYGPISSPHSSIPSICHFPNGFQISIKFLKVWSLPGRPASKSPEVLLCNYLSLVPSPITWLSEGMCTPSNSSVWHSVSPWSIDWDSWHSRCFHFGTNILSSFIFHHTNCSPSPCVTQQYLACAAIPPEMPTPCALCPQLSPAWWSPLTPNIPDPRHTINPSLSRFWGGSFSPLCGSHYSFLSIKLFEAKKQSLTWEYTNI